MVIPLFDPIPGLFLGYLTLFSPLLAVFDPVFTSFGGILPFYAIIYPLYTIWASKAHKLGFPRKGVLIIPRKGVLIIPRKGCFLTKIRDRFPPEWPTKRVKSGDQFFRAVGCV